MLTDAECKNAICPPEKKRARLACSGGLYLEISPAGSKCWFWKYRKDGKEARMALGSYPEVGAKEARKARDTAKLQKSDGLDPVMARKIDKLKAITPATDTFKATALEWYELKLDSWSSHYAIREKRNLAVAHVEIEVFAAFILAENVGNDIPAAIVAIVVVITTDPTSTPVQHIIIR